ncbi:MAG TPA: septal ring lytic transglycosylase RlpA family protein [Puia sp.]|nr:septal ring lytic transglycosylase RlpA family protein [Puia sp.]
MSTQKLRAGVLACMLLQGAAAAACAGRESANELLPAARSKAPSARAVFGAGRGEPTRDSIPHRRLHPPAAVKVQFGVASYYADKFEGRKTYTDEIFHQDSLTGASNTLPMHTWVRITNLRNHKTVIVVINDKMHPRNKRLIDLSRAAADHLGYSGRGLTRVRIDVLGKKRPREMREEVAAKSP